MKSARFHTLDAIRFFAFLKVFLLHLPDSDSSAFWNFIKQGGGTGVAVFFVLSGFLISNILIKRKIKLNTISPKRFFWRRAFRIWPLYFWGVIIAYLGIALTTHFNISNSTGYNPNPIFSFTFLENYKSIFEGRDPRGVPLQVFWSLCIEEHFYITWIVIFLITPIKHIVKVFSSLWVVAILARILSLKFLPEYAINGAELITSLDYFVVGGLIATSINGLLPSLNLKLNSKIKLTIFSIGIAYMLLQHVWYNSLGVFGITLAAIIYGTCIWACVIDGDDKIIIKDSSILSKLGVISYGLYVYHTVVLMITIKLYDIVGFSYHSSLGLISFIIVTLGTSIIVSFVSYRYFETYFLKIRERYFQ